MTVLKTLQKCSIFIFLLFARAVWANDVMIHYDITDSVGEGDVVQGQILVEVQNLTDKGLQNVDFRVDPPGLAEHGI